MWNNGLERDCFVFKACISVLNYSFEYRCVHRNLAPEQHFRRCFAKMYVML